MTEEKEIAITAELTRIVFKNDSGFLIGAFLADKADPSIGLEEQNFTAIGTLMNPQLFMEYKIFGDWKDTPKYGRQLAFTRFETQMPVDPDGIFKYLVRSCKHVGSSVGQALVDLYGADTLTVMKTDPERVAKEISGITPARAEKIKETLVKNEENEKVMVELETILAVPGMLKNMAGKLYTEYKANAAERVKGNPYILTRFPRVGFALADRVALHIGFSRTSVERKKAAAVHCMRENGQEGSTWITQGDLLMKMKELIQIVDMEAGIQALIEDRVLVLDDGKLAFSGPANDEKMIATKAILMLAGNQAKKACEEVAA